MIDSVEVRRGTYHDSVRLMQASRALQQASGVEEALVAMATNLNHELLQGMGFDLAAIGEAGPNDLIVAVRAADDHAVAHARQVLEEALVVRAATDSGMLSPPVAHVVGSVAAGPVPFVAAGDGAVGEGAAEGGLTAGVLTRSSFGCN